MVAIISWSRTLHPTPPTMSTSVEPVCAIARSVTSTSIAKIVSWSVYARSLTVYSPDASSRGACSSNDDSTPEKLTSMPLMTYGRLGQNLRPRLASCSTL
eukprot:Amastigsp_a846023_108.p3 type:complete len:100 gc:universal Amastigsp_a846023_108:194-493(+)